MENNPTEIEKLIQKAESYSRTSLELLKLTAILKSADLFSNVATKLLIGFFIIMFTLLLNIGFALWIGQQLGQNYYGFFAIAFIYLFFGIVFYIFRNSWIKNPVSNFIIVKLQKKN